MRSDRTTPFLIISALVAALLVGLTVGGAGPMSWLRALASGPSAPVEAAQTTATPPRATRLVATPTEAPTARPSPTRLASRTATRTPEPSATAEPTAAPSATAEPTAEPPLPPTEAPPAATPAPEPTVTLSASTRRAVNFRTGPGADSEAIATLAGGTALTLIGRNEDASWLRARLEDGREGWLTSDPAVVAVDGDILTLALVE